jgi:membrane protein
MRGVKSAAMSPKHSISRLWYRYFRRSAAVRQTLVSIVERTARRMFEDNVVDLAAQVAFYFVLSLVPFLIVLSAIVGWLPSTTLWPAIAQWITDYFPDRTRQAVLGTILDLTRGYNGYVFVGLLAAVWSASSGFMSLMEALSVACCGKDKRTYWKKRAIATGTTLSAVLFCFMGFGLWTAAHWAKRTILPEFKYVGIVHVRFAAMVWWLATVVLMFVALALVNHFLPDVKRRWRWLAVGNIFSVTAIILVTIGFNLFLRYSPTIPRVSTILAGFVLLMTWIYVVILIVLSGVELDTAVRELSKRN